MLSDRFITVMQDAISVPDADNWLIQELFNETVFYLLSSHLLSETVFNLENHVVLY